MPLVFICEDNGIGISVPTPQAWLESQYGHRPVCITFVADGLNLCDTYMQAQRPRVTRESRKPVFLTLKPFVCLAMPGPIGNVVLFFAKIEAAEFNDPFLHSARIALENGFASAAKSLICTKLWKTDVAAIGEY